MGMKLVLQCRTATGNTYHLVHSFELAHASSGFCHVVEAQHNHSTLIIHINATVEA